MGAVPQQRAGPARVSAGVGRQREAAASAMVAIAAVDDADARQSDAVRGSHPRAAPLDSIVRVFSAEPDLLAGIDADAAELLTQRVVTPKLWLEPGPWKPSSADDLSGSLGLLVLDGLIIRTVELQGRCWPELVGSGDLLRPWDDLDASLGHVASWAALDRASVAVLDERFCAVAARWPSIMAQLLTRSIQRSCSLAVNLAIVHARHADLRLHMLFWHLADRWGRVTRDGVHLPMRLTHDMLAALACIRRPTASSALNDLARRGEIARCDDGTWLLTGCPPTPAPFDPSAPTARRIRAGSHSASARHDP